MATTNTVSFSGNVIESTVTNQSAVADTWIQNITSSSTGQKIIVGMDIEWDPVESTPKTAILQLCVGTKCLILQLSHMSQIPQSVRNFVADSNVTLVGVETASDAAKLKADYGLSCKNVVDVRELAAGQYPDRLSARAGLADIAKVVAGLEVSKPDHVRRSAWGNAVLSNEQVQYATIDAFASFKIGQKLVV